MKKISCGIIILNEQKEVLLCHVTGQWQHDIPKGKPEEKEEHIEAAIRETEEECGLVFSKEQLKDLGIVAYNKEKNLHLFLVEVIKDYVNLETLTCTSFFERGPEMDGYKWVNISEVEKYCVPNMARTLTTIFSV